MNTLLKKALKITLAICAKHCHTLRYKEADYEIIDELLLESISLEEGQLIPQPCFKDYDKLYDLIRLLDCDAINIPYNFTICISTLSGVQNLTNYNYICHDTTATFKQNEIILPAEPSEDYIDVEKYIYDDNFLKYLNDIIETYHHINKYNCEFEPTNIIRNILFDSTTDPEPYHLFRQIFTAIVNEKISKPYNIIAIQLNYD